MQGPRQPYCGLNHVVCGFGPHVGYMLLGGVYINMGLTNTPYCGYESVNDTP
jgi:hypothetical protein